MASTNTTRLQLFKATPDTSETFRTTDVNANMDKIDNFVVDEFDQLGIFAAYVPVESGSTLNKGADGTLTGFYTRIGDIIIGKLMLTTGGAGFSAGTGPLVFSLPVAAHADYILDMSQVGSTVWLDTGTGYFSGYARVTGASKNQFQVVDADATAGGMSSSVMASGDQIDVSFMYRAVAA